MYHKAEGHNKSFVIYRMCLPLFQVLVFPYKNINFYTQYKTGALIDNVAFCRFWVHKKLCSLRSWSSLVSSLNSAPAWSATKMKPFTTKVNTPLNIDIIRTNCSLKQSNWQIIKEKDKQKYAMTFRLTNKQTENL